MQLIALFAAGVLLGLLSPPVAAEDLAVTSAHGGRVPVIAEFPPGAGPHPAVVLAPGSGYHMRLPALAETSQALVRSGIAVYRFDWAYFSAQPKGRPSEDLAREVQDMEAVLAAARKDARVDAARLAVGGKSLGSLVSWRVFAADPKLAAAVMLTPVCSQLDQGAAKPRSEAAENYPGFAAEPRAALWVSGDRDPLLYEFAATGKARHRVVIAARQP